MRASLAALLSLAFASSAHWISLKTPRVEMYTTKEQGTALQELQHLEEISTFFATTRPFGTMGAAKPVQVLSFGSNAEFTPYAYRAEGGAYYVHTYNSDYILIGDNGSRDRALVAHEFTHMVVTQAGLQLPIWLNEGIADYYSTVELNGKQATIGRAPVRYLETLHRQQWIPWDTLFAVDGASHLYNDSGNLAILYSQSWALTHMLELDGRYSSHFKQFLMDVSAGQESKAALQSTYHKSMAEIDADLAAYLRGRNLPSAILPYTPDAELPAPAAGDAADFDVQFALANVLAWKPGTRAEGQKKLTDLSSHYAERPEPEEDLAMLALQQNKRDEAQRHFGVAVQRHSRDPEVLYNDALLEKAAGGKYGSVSALLRQALTIRPDMDKARLELGFLEYEDFQYKSSLSLLSAVTDVPEDSRFEVYFTIAQCYVNLDDLAKAETYIKKAAAAAGTNDQKQQAADLLESVTRDKGADSATDSSPTQPELPVTNVRGLAKVLRCNGSQKSLGVDVNGREMTFDIDDPDLVVRNPTEAYSHWTCGPLKSVTLTVVYRPRNDTTTSGQHPDGKAIELVF